jgi:hypothetical protein
VTPAEWFWLHGLHVFPTIHKVPDIPRGTSWKDYRCSREQAARFREYGVPLGLLAVIDSDRPDVEAWAAAHAPDTPLRVRTARGWHRGYRLSGDAPHFIHRDGLTIEFRHRGQYVVGPGSVRPDGVIYEADAWSWDIRDVPFFPADFVFDDRPLSERGSADGEPFELPEVVRAGERHDQLFRFLRSCKGSGFDRDETRELVTMVNHKRCDPPLEEDATFERWFTRQWNKPDRPFTPTRAPEIPDRPLEPNALTGAWDLDAPGGSL